MGFGRIPRLIESSRIFGYRVGVSRNLRLRFRVRATYYRVFLYGELKLLLSARRYGT